MTISQTAEWTWLDGLSILWRRRLHIAAGTIAAGVLTLAVVLLVPRTHEAVIDLRIGMVEGKPIEDPYYVAAWINGDAFKSRLQKGGFAGMSIDSLDMAVSADLVHGEGGGPAYVAVLGRSVDPNEAVRLANVATAIVIEEHRKRFNQFMSRLTQYRDNLTAQIAAIKTEVSAIDESLKRFRERPSVNVPGILLMRAQLEEKQEQLLRFMKELRDTEIGITTNSLETHVLGDPVVPRGRMRPARTLITLAGAAAGAMIAMFWALVADADASRPLR